MKRWLAPQFFAISGLVLLLVLGCNASGWAPGAASPQLSEVPLPGGAALKVSGENFRDLEIENMVGVPGAAYPSIGRLRYMSDPTVALLTRGQQQTAIEGQRWDKAIQAFERGSVALTTAAERLAGLPQLQPGPDGAGNDTPVREAAQAAALEAIAAFEARLKKLEEGQK